MNTIKLLTDTVSGLAEGPFLAARILTHKIHSPQEQAVVQALAVQEAHIRSCGTCFHAEVGRFKFLNELIKLISPKYLAGSTPEHLMKNVVVLLYKWIR